MVKQTLPGEMKGSQSFIVYIIHFKNPLIHEVFLQQYKIGKDTTKHETEVQSRQTVLTNPSKF